MAISSQNLCTLQASVLVAFGLLCAICTAISTAHGPKMGIMLYTSEQDHVDQEGEEKGRRDSLCLFPVSIQERSRKRGSKHHTHEKVALFWPASIRKGHGAGESCILHNTLSSKPDTLGGKTTLCCMNN